MKKTMFSMALVLSLTFGFIIASCDNNLTGTDPQALSASDAPLTQKIKVHFNVKNGGNGLTKSQGEVIAEDGVSYNTGGASFASNFSISFEAPVGNTYVKIQWSGKDGLGHWTYLSAKLNLVFGVVDYNILVDYNGRGKVYTEGLDEVSVWK